MNKFAVGIAVSCACLWLAFFVNVECARGNSQAAAVKGHLHRLDFRVEGASCVICLRRIGQKFRDTRGVLKADVSIYRPYWAIVIYDANQTNVAKIGDAIKAERVKLVDLVDKPIAEMPAVIVPKMLSGSSR